MAISESRNGCKQEKIEEKENKNGGVWERQMKLREWY